MWFGVVTLFPELFKPFAEVGVFGRAVQNGIIEFQCWNPRDFAEDKHRTVDDRPYGGGPGMILMAAPLQKAIHAAKQAAKKQPLVVHLTPQGSLLNQTTVEQYVRQSELILLAGRYEGIDERLIELEVDEEISIGDYVCSGGELPAMIFMDALTRQVPGVLGHAASHQEDSFFSGLLDCPHYTRPEIYQGRRVPNVLLSGNHGTIARWRMKESLGRTWKRRPDLFSPCKLTKEQKVLLDEYIAECKATHV